MGIARFFCILILLIVCLSSYKYPILQNNTELIIGKWKLDSFHLYTDEDLNTSSKTRSIGYMMSLKTNDFKEVNIHGLRLKLHQHILFTREQTIYGSKIRLNRKTHRSSVQFQVKDKVLDLFHKENPHHPSQYKIKTLTAKKLVLEGSLHPRGCYSYAGTLFYSKK